jgi:hypothetical protein
MKLLRLLVRAIALIPEFVGPGGIAAQVWSLIPPGYVVYQVSRCARGALDR